MNTIYTIQSSLTYFIFSYRSTIQNFPRFSIEVRLVCLSCLFQKMPERKPQGKMREGPEGERMAVLSRTSKLLHQCLHILSTFFLHSINSDGLCQTKQWIIGNTSFPLPDHDCSTDGSLKLSYFQFPCHLVPYPSFKVDVTI